jgi:hypothetical protein
MINELVSYEIKKLNNELLWKKYTT